MSTTTEIGRVPATPATGLYRLKPWFADRLHPLLGLLDRAGISPDTVSATGVLAAIAGGLVLALAGPGILAAAAVLAAAVVRLAAANLDGSLARRRWPRRFGAVVNELGDRLADLFLLAGLAYHVGGLLAGALLLASCLPSWVALCAAAAGARRRNGGPMGKTERAFLCVVAAATGWWLPLALVIAIGSVLTAGVRLRHGARELS